MHRFTNNTKTFTFSLIVGLLLCETGLRILGFKPEILQLRSFLGLLIAYMNTKGFMRMKTGYLRLTVRQGVTSGKT